MAARPSLRVTMRRVHLWLGLTIGVLFAFAGLTGSLLVFYPEIDAVLSPVLRAVPSEARPASWQAVVDTLHREHPARTGAWRIEVSGEGGADPRPVLHTEGDDRTRLCAAACLGRSGAFDDDPHRLLG